MPRSSTCRALLCYWPRARQTCSTRRAWGFPNRRRERHRRLRHHGDVPRGPISVRGHKRMCHLGWFTASQKQTAVIHKSSEGSIQINHSLGLSVRPAVRHIVRVRLIDIKFSAALVFFVLVYCARVGALIKSLFIYKISADRSTTRFHWSHCVWRLFLPFHSFNLPFQCVSHIFDGTTLL